LAGHPDGDVFKAPPSPPVPWQVPPELPPAAASDTESDDEQQKRLPIVHNVKAKPKPTPRLDADVAKYLKDQYAKGRRLVISEGPAGAQVKLESVLDDGTALAGTLAPAERRAYAESWKQAALKIDWDVTLDTGDVSHAVDLLAERCVGIAGTTRQEIADLIIQGTREQWSDAEIAEKIGQLGFERSAARAPLITRTELAIASTTAARDAYTASGIVSEMEWLTGPDPCPECQERDGKHYALDSAPELPAHPACRCDWAPIVSESLVMSEVPVMQT
jgi:SPP1 gp7 family putative phage head morphogenesis protein